LLYSPSMQKIADDSARGVIILDSGS